MTTLQAILLAIIEGITEFLPISSTAHMVFASSLMGIESDEFVKTYEVAIQLGAILAIVVLYFKKFVNFSRLDFYVKLIIATIPALIFGKLFNDYIDEILEKPLPIAIVMLVGGVILLFVDKWFTKETITSEEQIDNKMALKLGLFQVLAVLFPGLSRSAATIVGGMSQGLTRAAAAEFSFFLAVPTMFAATAYKLYKYKDTINADTIKLLAIGNIVAFIVAFFAVKFFIDYLTKYGFKAFGYYRIALGLFVILLWFVK
jgi:undecaprenyl-diphosphatase